jgi:peptidyl-prolyl cis-trans isomerase SurA|tara:strand:+ start:663 stop:1886 length:1224 start_codon:yes stop_codon:yes gene_type:complete
MGMFLVFLICNKVNAKENYIVALVNNIPITKIDVEDKAKLLAYSIEKDISQKNLNKFFNQSLKSLITENLIRGEGLKFNKNILNLVKNKAYSNLLSDYNQSDFFLNQLIQELNISKSVVLNKYETEIILGILLQNKFKQQFENLNQEIQEIITEKELEKNKDKFELAEIIIPKPGNLELFNKIKNALNKGSNFSYIAEQVSINPSAKKGGNIGWRTLENLPIEITSNNQLINEGDIFYFIKKNTYRIIKILVKRHQGKISNIEDQILLAVINFKINFGEKKAVYLTVKDEVDDLLKNNKGCNELKKFNNNINKDITLRVINSRIADLDVNLQNKINNLKLYEIMKPIYEGNKGYLYILCDKAKNQLINFNPDLIKKELIDERISILSSRYLKKLNQNAVIKLINDKF